MDIVILTWNDGPLLERAVNSALQSEGVSVSVIVVDNGSDCPAEVIDDPRVQLVRAEENLGVSRGRNLGARLGSSALVCFLDSDAELLPGTLAGLAESLLARSDVGLIGPVFCGQRPEDSGGAAPSLSRKLSRVIGRTTSYRRARSAYESVWDVDFVIGACQVFRRSAYEDVGGLDERWFYGPEDVDFCLRLHGLGWRVIQADIGCRHPPRRRNRHLLTRRGLSHAFAVAQFLWRHRGYESVVR